MAERRDFALYPVARTEIAVLQGRVDGWFREEHRIGLDKTRYPVESGSTLTDNAVSLPERLRLEGLVSDLLPAPGNTLTPDRATDTWDAIVALAKSRQPFDVVTPIRVYRNMLIVRAEAPRNRNTGKALRFTIDLEELLAGSTDITRIPGNQVDGPAEGRSSTIDGGDRGSPVIQASSTTLESIEDSSLPALTAPIDPRRGGLAFATIAPMSGAAAAGGAVGIGSIIQQLPLTGDPSQTFRTVLAGQPIRIRQWWQPLDENHYVALAKLDQTPIASGLRLVSQGRALIGQSVDFTGDLYVDGVGDLGRDAWTTTHRLLYLPEGV